MQSRSIDFGMPTLIEFATLDENVELCRQLGLRFVELNMNLPICCPERLGSSRIKHIARETNIDFTLHLPEELNLASFQPSIRKGHVYRCKEAIEWAGASGIRLVNMHMNPGVYFSLPDRKVWIYERYTEEYLANIVQSVSELIVHASGFGVTLSIENTGDFKHLFMREALKLLSRIDGFALTWDVGHDAASGYLDRDVLMEHADSIRHMHLHDCVGNSSHQALFTGCVDTHSMLEFAKRNSIRIVIEVKTAKALSESVLGIQGEDGHDPHDN